MPSRNGVDFSQHLPTEFSMNCPYVPRSCGTNESLTEQFIMGLRDSKPSLPPLSLIPAPNLEAHTYEWEPWCHFRGHKASKLIFERLPLSPGKSVWPIAVFNSGKGACSKFRKDAYLTCLHVQKWKYTLFRGLRVHDLSIVFRKNIWNALFFSIHRVIGKNEFPRFFPWHP